MDSGMNIIGDGETMQESDEVHGIFKLRQIFFSIEMIK